MAVYVLHHMLSVVLVELPKVTSFWNDSYLVPMPVMKKVVLTMTLTLAMKDLCLVS